MNEHTANPSASGVLWLLFVQCQQLLVTGTMVGDEHRAVGECGSLHSRPSCAGLGGLCFVVQTMAMRLLTQHTIHTHRLIVTAC